MMQRRVSYSLLKPRFAPYNTTLFCIASCYLHPEFSWVRSFPLVDSIVTCGHRGRRDRLLSSLTIPMEEVPSVLRRRSPRLLAAESEKRSNNDSTALNDDSIPSPASKKPRRKVTTKKAPTDSSGTVPQGTVSSTAQVCNDESLTINNEEIESKSFLPRTRERCVKGERGYEHVMGIDEAGRGPLCGPVVVAAIILPTDVAGITDSKKLTRELDRENLYETILQTPNIRWAVAVQDAQRIDEINILQATMEGMRNVAHAVIQGDCTSVINGEGGKTPCFTKADVSHTGCYVVLGATDTDGIKITVSRPSLEPTKVYALVDGNRLPKDMPCQGESIVKGDSREYVIAAASILAKVTRDRLMNAYDLLYPIYNLKQNKGYPTQDHMALVRQHGAAPIYRRTFKPLKEMQFDEEGKILNP